MKCSTNCNLCKTANATKKCGKCLYLFHIGRRNVKPRIGKKHKIVCRDYLPGLVSILLQARITTTVDVLPIYSTVDGPRSRKLLFHEKKEQLPLKNVLTKHLTVKDDGWCAEFKDASRVY